MPKKINMELELMPARRVIELRNKIKDGEGWEVEEIASHLQIAESTVRYTMRKNKWSIPQYSKEKRRIIQVLVNPKTLSLCQTKSK
tara:strand:+ start:8535 stop:8792 length:258 start_codon:yes stop_codon:yes gene_type:complete